MDAVSKIISRQQCVEFGLVCVGAVLGFSLYLKDPELVIIALLLTLISIISPRIFFPFTFLWFGLAKILNIVSTTLIMTSVFFLIVVPVALARQLMSKDGLRLKEFKKQNSSVLHERNHTYTKDDLRHTF